MAKKNKRNIKALLAKRAELQALNQRPTLAIPGAPKGVATNQAELPAPAAANAPALVAHQTGSEIWRTLIATAVIAILLAGVVLTDRQKPYLDFLGAKIYQALELGS